MSAPADPNASTPSSSNLAGVTNGTAEQAKDTSELPPAALDLAAKLFDLARNGEADTLKAYMDAGQLSPSFTPFSIFLTNSQASLPTSPTTPVIPSSCSQPTTTSLPPSQCCSPSAQTRTS